MTAPAALLAIALFLLAACDERQDRTFATAADLAGMVEKGWLPPLPSAARAVRVAWDLDLSTSFFCGEAPWEDLRGGFQAPDDAALPEERPETAPDWWWEKARSGTETLRVSGESGQDWAITRTAPEAFCGASLAAWQGGA